MVPGGSLTKLSLSGFLKGAPTFSTSVVASTTFAEIVVGSSPRRPCIQPPIKHQNRVSMEIDVNKFNTPAVSDAHLSDVNSSKGFNALDSCETNGAKLRVFPA
jgi:hypothetical protein